MVAKVRLNNVDKVFPPQGGGDPVVAVENTTLSVEPKEFVSIVGPSGCGKSTILNMVAGLLEPSSGEITIDGTVVKAKPSEGAVHEWSS